MPRQTRRKNGERNSQLPFNDFTLYDYSHSSKDGSTQHTLRTSAKLTSQSKALMDEQQWFEKDLSDFDDTPDDESTEEHREYEEKAAIAKRLQNHSNRRRARHIANEEDQEERRDYPLDLWFLIARYINPEDIAKFSLLCRASNYVSNTIVFWMRLFYKHNKKEATKLGRLLLREHVSIVRTHVIKSLFQVYPVFQQRLDKTAVIQKDPHFLRSARCVRIWSTSTKANPAAAVTRTSYNYYFEFRFDAVTNSEMKKMALPPVEVQSALLRASHQATIDKNSCILHLLCSNFIPIGPYMGMILKNVSLNMSSDYHYQKLRMLFDPSRVSVSSTNASSFSKSDATSEVVIDPILCLKVYNWYNWNSPTH